MKKKDIRYIIEISIFITFAMFLVIFGCSVVATDIINISFKEWITDIYQAMLIITPIALIVFIPCALLERKIFNEEKRRKII